MKTYSLYSFFGFLLLTLLSVSCSSELDFDQVNDFKLEPAYIANLSYFDIPANRFVDNGTQQTVVFNAVEFDVFRDKFFRENLKKADLFFEFTNTTNRAFTVDIVFFDINNQPLYVIPFTVPAYNGSPNPVTKTEVFENAKLDLLKQSRSMGYVVTIAAGTPLNANSPGSLKLRSSATVYLAVE